MSNPQRKAHNGESDNIEYNIPIVKISTSIR